MNIYIPVIESDNRTTNKQIEQPLFTVKVPNFTRKIAQLLTSMTNYLNVIIKYYKYLTYSRVVFINKTKRKQRICE